MYILKACGVLRPQRINVHEGEEMNDQTGDVVNLGRWMLHSLDHM